MAQAENVYTWETIRGHDAESDAWVVLDGEVFDVTKFLREHPGGSSIVLPHLGTEISEVDLVFSRYARVKGRLLTLSSRRYLPMKTFIATANRLMISFEDTKSVCWRGVKLPYGITPRIRGRPKICSISQSPSCFRQVSFHFFQTQRWLSFLRISVEE